MPTKKKVKPVKKAAAKSAVPARKKATAVKKASPAQPAKKAKPAKPASKDKIAANGDPTLLQRITAPILNLIHPVKKGKKKKTS